MSLGICVITCKTLSSSHLLDIERETVSTFYFPLSLRELQEVESTPPVFEVKSRGFEIV